MLLIVIDTLRADRLGAYGERPTGTPTLDRLAEEAQVFDSAVSTAPFTMPAVAALMTGRYPDRVGISNHSADDRLEPSTPTLAEIARSAGYATAAVVTNPWLAKRAMGFSRGFATFSSGRELGHGSVRVDARAVTDRAIDLLDADRQPLLLWVHYMDAHMPYRPPADFARAAGASSETSAVIDDFTDRNRDQRQRIYFEAPYPEAALAETRRLYDASVRFIDSEIARLLGALDERGMSERTIVVVAADHGESLGDHGLHFAHDFTLYDELLHVPLLIKVPGQAPARHAAPVSLVDVVPTLCALARLECRGDLDGVALPPASPEAPRGRFLFAAGPPQRARYDRNPYSFVDGIDGRWTMVRRDGFKLIGVPHPDALRWQLYNLDVDPGEQSDRWSTEDEGRREELSTALLAWQREMDDARPERNGDAPGLGHRTRQELRSLGYLD